MRLLHNPKIPFMSYRKIGFLVSGTLLLISLGSLILQGGPRFGIDFRGGTLLEYRFEDKTDPAKSVEVAIDQVRDTFTEAGYSEAEIKYFGSLQDVAVQVDVGDVTEEVEAELDGFSTLLNEKFTDYTVEERRRESVGPKIGKELVLDAVLAILGAMVLILVYIMFRFEFKFGVGAVTALFHDILITLGIFSVFQIEITVAVIAALLAIIGYSLNDTIVVYDRIRENLKTFKRKASDYVGVVNTSINETLSRTVVTSGTTLMVVMVLYFAGIEVIKDFSLALICGVIIGTYSSIFIASPVIVEWNSGSSSSSQKK